MPVYSEIVLTEADFVNLNRVAYRSDSLRKAVIELDKYARLGLVEGFDGHPKPLFDENGEPIGFDYTELEPAFILEKLWFDEYKNQVLGLIRYLETEAGKRLSILARRESLRYSIRAIIENCAYSPTYKVCDLYRLDGVDRVITPAVPQAVSLRTYTTDSINNLFLAINHHKGRNILMEWIKLLMEFLAQLEGVLSVVQASGGYLTTDVVIKLTETVTSMKHMILQAMEQMQAEQNAEEPNSNEGDSNSEPSERAATQDAKREILEQALKKVEAVSSVVRKIGMPVQSTQVNEQKQPVTDQMNNLIEVMETKIKSIDELVRNSKQRKETVVDDSLCRRLSQLEKIVTDQRAKEEREKVRKSVQDHILEIEKSGNFEGCSFAAYPESVVQKVLDGAKKESSTESATKYMRDMLAVADSMLAVNKSVEQYKGKGSPLSASNIELVADEADNGWKKVSEKLGDAIKSKVRKNPELRKKIEYATDQVKGFSEENLKCLHENNAFRKKLKLSSRDTVQDNGIIITEEDLRNQEGVIAEAIFRESILLTEGLQWAELYPSNFSSRMGRIFKIPNSGYIPPKQGTYRKYYETRTGEAIAESRSTLRYTSIFSRMRCIGFTMPEQIAWQLENGPVSFDALADLVLYNAQDLSNQTTRMIFDQIHYCADERQPIRGCAPNSPEVVLEEQWFWSNSGGVKVDLDGELGSVTLGENVFGAAKLLTGYEGGDGYVGEGAAHPRIVLLPREELFIDEDNMEEWKTFYGIEIKSQGEFEFRLGEFDSAMNIVDSYPGQGANCACSAEGFIGFKATADTGLSQTVRPTINSYWYAHPDSYAEFNLTGDRAVPARTHYAGLINAILERSSTLSDERNLVEPDNVLMHSRIGRSVYSIADYHRKDDSPAGFEFLPEFSKSSLISRLPGPLAVTQTNGGLRSGSRRIFVLKTGFVKYCLGVGSQPIGPYPAMIAPKDGGPVALTPAEKRYVRILDAAKAVVPKVEGGVANYPVTQIRLTGQLRTV